MAGVVDPAPSPLADALIVVSDAEPADSNLPNTFQLTVDQVLWQSSSTEAIERTDPIASGKAVVDWDPSAAERATELTSGEVVVLGVQGRRDDGALPIRWSVAVDGASVLFLGQEPFATRNTLIFETFQLATSDPTASASPVDFLVAWNDEAAQGPSGPIQNEWASFRETFVLQQGEFPSPGTAEYWAAAPPECRSVSDAPSDVLASLTPAEVWLTLDPAWVTVDDAVVCLSSALGSLGCASFDAVRAGEPIRFDVNVSISEPITLQIAHQLSAGVSWLERTPIGTIPPEAIVVSRSVTAEIGPPGPGLHRYADLVGSSSEVSVRIRQGAPDLA